MTLATKESILTDIFGSFYSSGDEIVFHCPKCHHHKKKLSVNIDKNVFKCWVCNYNGKTIYRLVKRYGSFNQRQAWEELDGIFDISKFSVESLFGLGESEEEQVINLPESFKSLVNKTLPIGSVYPIKYLASRGITKSDIIRWKMGYCSSGEYSGRIIVPSFNLDGNVNYFVARTYTGDWKKYSVPDGLSKDIIFNELYLDFKNDLVLTEGVFDAIKAENAVPLLGSSLREDSKLFQQIIKHDTTVFVALDADAERKASKLIKSLLSYDTEVYKIDVSGFNDVGEMSKKEFSKRKRNATLVNIDSYIDFAIRAI